MSDRLQYYVWHKTRKILKGPFNIDPHEALEVFMRETQYCFKMNDPLYGSSEWVGGTLEAVFRTPGVDRFEVARELAAR